MSAHVSVVAVSDDEHRARVAVVSLLAEHLQRMADHELVALGAALAAHAQLALAARVHELAKHAREHARPWQREDRPRVVGVEGGVEGVLCRDDQLGAVGEHVARLARTRAQNRDRLRA